MKICKLKSNGVFGKATKSSKGTRYLTYDELNKEAIRLIKENEIFKDIIINTQKKLNYSDSKLALMFNTSVSTIKSWKEGKTTPWIEIKKNYNKNIK